MIEDDNLPPDAGAEVPAEGQPSEGAAKDTVPAAQPEKDSAGAKPEGADAGDGAGDDVAGEKKSKPGSAKLKEKVQRLEAEIAELRSRGEVTPDEPKFPKLEDFDFDVDRYEAAKATFAAQQAARTIRAEERDQLVGVLERERAAAMMGAHEARLADARERIPEFDKAIASAKAIPATAELNRAVIESEKSALLLHHLSSRPEEVAALNQMSPTQLARRIGQIEARLSYPTARTQSNAPPPVGGLRGGSAPSFDPATASHEEMKKLFARK